MSESARHEGIVMKLGGREYVVPPLSLASMKRLKDRIQALASLQGLPSETQVDAIVDIVHAALVRNYPDLKKDEVADLVDLSNLGVVVPAVLGASGLTQVRKQPGEGVSPAAVSEMPSSGER